MSNTPKTLVENLHVLVHPGFYIMQGLPEEKHRIPLHQQELWRRYNMQAIRMTTRDVMIAALCCPLGELKNDFESHSFIRRNIEHIQSILQSRLYIIGNGIPSFMCDVPTATQASDQLTLVAAEFHANGYEIDSTNTRAVVYGETLKRCVPFSAAKVRAAYGLAQAATIPVHYTNVGVRNNETREMQAKRFAQIRHDSGSPDIVFDWSIPQ